MDESTCIVDKVLRTIYIAGDITLKQASRFRRTFRTLEGSSDPITVEINSLGGDVEAGFMIMDTIRLSDCKVITRATGVAMSMGSMILVVGDERESLPSASIMVHQGSFSLSAKAEDLDNETDELKRIESLCWQIMDDQTGKPLGFWKHFCGGKNKYLTADKALAEGLIHKICG